MKKPLIFMDPFPRNQSMVFTSDCAAALGQMGDIVAHWGSRAPDELVEQHLKDMAISFKCCSTNSSGARDPQCATISPI